MHLIYRIINMKSFLIKSLIVVIAASCGSLLFLYTTDYNDQNINIAVQSWLIGTIIGLIFIIVDNVIYKFTKTKMFIQKNKMRKK